ncbi:hypothetical protein D3C87_2076830 [compost metagenome]
MGGGDVGHVEGRVLAQKDHVHGRKIEPFRLAEREVVALDVAQRHLLRRRENLAVAQRQLLRGIVEEPVAAGLCLKAHRER